MAPHHLIIFPEAIKLRFIFFICSMPSVDKIKVVLAESLYKIISLPLHNFLFNAQQQYHYQGLALHIPKIK